VFQKDNFERIVEILQKLLYNTRPLGPLQPRQYYSTRSASSSHKISGSAVKAILTDFYCKILLFHPVSNFNTLRQQFESGKTQKTAGRRVSVAIGNTKVTIAITIIQV
jgi:uncharacterized surface protein with fasciclin (FAS1) repeats